MIRFLSIQNLAVIDALELEFESGLNVLTGETGAGKSIVVGAVGLLLGGRASPDLVRTGEEAAVIQAIFETPEGREVIARREISAQGRSRAFIDGVLATSGALKERIGSLVDIHGQHDHEALLDPASHLDVLDEFGGLTSRREQVSIAFRDLRALRTELDRVRMAERERLERTDFVKFQINEIERVAPKPAEDDELAATRQVLANAERLQQLCAQSYEILYGGDDAILARLGGVWRQIGELATLDQQFRMYVEARGGIKSQLEDLAYFLRSYGAGIDASPERLQEVEGRLATLERLKKKYGPSLADVLQRLASLRTDLQNLDSAAERDAELTAAVAASRERYVNAARSLALDRRTAGLRFTRMLERQLADLAMERTRCELRFNDTELPEAQWTERGMDAAEFFLSPNPGEELRPLAKIASGGELSRIMLALKTLASTDAVGKTLVFDEVDAGIGGRVADVVGGKLRRLGDRFQVLCITHLPQIAAYGTAHARISKGVRRNRTITTVERLHGEARVEEIARMIGGAEVSLRVRASAAEMLAGRVGDEGNTKGESERVKGKGKRVG